MYTKEHYLNLFGVQPAKELPDKMSIDIYELDDDMKHFVQLVFAPDPVTGNPSSDVAYMLTGSDDGFKSFIKEKLMSSVPQGSLAESADEAMSLVKRNLVTSEQFQSYITEYVRDMINRSSD